MLNKTKRIHLIILTFLGLCWATASPAGDADPRFNQGWEAYQAGRYAQARQLWLPLAKTGHVDAQINLGVMYDSAIGTPEQPSEALRWYRAAAQQNHRAAQYNLAQMYLHGRGTPRDYRSALQWFQRAAQQGLDVAQYNLGMLYLQDGTGVQDTTQALRWLRAAAEQGYADAQFNLAALYAEGKAGAAQQLTALDWYYRAGKSYLKRGDRPAAKAVIDAIRRRHAEHLYVRRLRDQLRPSTAPAHAQPALQTSAAQSVGTAWPIAHGYAITNHHVVDEVDNIRLVRTDGTELHASVVLRDEVNDIAVLSVADPSQLPPALPLTRQPSSLGTSVFTIGYPRIDVMGPAPKLTNGIVSSESGLRGNPANYQISVPIQPGNSGGPLLNMRGEVVGVITAMLGAAHGPNDVAQPLPNIGYALKAEVLQQLLASLPGRNARIPVLHIEGHDLASLAGRIQHSVMIVYAGK